MSTAMLPRSVALACFLRSFCINAAITARGMQEIGLAYVLEPGLTWLYPDPAARTRALTRYAGHSNTHVFMIPLYAGVALSLEMQISRGMLPEDTANMVRETLSTTLSALGDSFFSGTVLPLWAMVSVFLLLTGCVGGMALLTGGLLLCLLVLRLLAFFAGLRHGMAVLIRLRRLDLINQVGRLKTVNALLVALLVWQLVNMQTVPLQWTLYAVGAPLMFAAVWLMRKWRLPRILLWLLMLGALILMEEGLPVLGENEPVAHTQRVAD